MDHAKAIGGSFRDPAGYVFQQNGALYRRITPGAIEDFELLISSGLHGKLVKAGMLVDHEPVDRADASVVGDDGSIYIKPRPVPFVSYPCEWCFGQLKSAAILTLDIQLEAMRHGMTLKDASAFNVQFVGARPVFIDTLSFEQYAENKPWVAYGQFCRHFLGPLALMSMCDTRVATGLFRANLDGPALDLVSNLLPWSSRLSMGILTHIHMHAKFVTKYGGGVKTGEKNLPRHSRNALLGIIESLRKTVKSIKLPASSSEWGDYYDSTTYTPPAMDHKATLVGEFLDFTSPAVVWDFGANTGRFTQIPADHGAYTVAFDIDHQAVQKHYESLITCPSNHGSDTLPLVLDMTNPTPPLGWSLQERQSLMERGPCNVGLALALVHHLAISNNIPLDLIAKFFSDVCETGVIIEFVPKDDPQVRRMMAMRKDIFPDYTQDNFERAFERYFRIDRAQRIVESPRTLYLMTRP